MNASLQLFIVLSTMKWIPLTPFKMLTSLKNSRISCFDATHGILLALIKYVESKLNGDDRSDGFVASEPPPAPLPMDVVLSTLM